jgi:hypothetical protein
VGGKRADKAKTGVRTGSLERWEFGEEQTAEKVGDLGVKRRLKKNKREEVEWGK